MKKIKPGQVSLECRWVTRQARRQVGQLNEINSNSGQQSYSSISLNIRPVGSFFFVLLCLFCQWVARQKKNRASGKPHESHTTPEHTTHLTPHASRRTEVRRRRATWKPFHIHLTALALNSTQLNLNFTKIIIYRRTQQLNCWLLFPLKDWTDRVLSSIVHPHVGIIRSISTLRLVW